MKVRFYQYPAGQSPCTEATFPEQVVQGGGVPMGGTMGAVAAGAAWFVVQAAKGSTPIATIDIIKATLVNGVVKGYVYSLQGKVAFADGTAPASFSALASQRRAGMRHFGECDGQSKELPKEGSGGAIGFEGLPPGLYDLIISGPLFVEKKVGPFAVEAGAIKDLVTIFKGAFHGRTQAELTTAVANVADAGARQNSAHIGEKAESADIAFEDVAPGDHTLCGDVGRYGDDAAQADAQPVTCIPVTVRRAGAQQEISLALTP